MDHPGIPPVSIPREIASGRTNETANTMPSMNPDHNQTSFSIRSATGAMTLAMGAAAVGVQPPRPTQLVLRSIGLLLGEQQSYLSLVVRHVASVFLLVLVTAFSL